MVENTKYVLQMRNISKVFPGVIALNDVSLNIEKGKVHALIGENGAGKSTLMKILSGIYNSDKGEIILRNKKVNINGPKEALKNGISMIYQELNPIPEVTIAENVFVGYEPCYKFLGIVNKRELKRRTNELFNEIGVELNPDSKLSSLNVAEIQIVEIVKALSYNSEIIIMDEPTSAITDKEVEKLFEIVRKLSSKGKTIIYISHKLDEIFKIGDYVTVLRDGNYIDTKSISELNKQLLISLMVGRDIKNIFPKENVKFGDVLFEVRSLNKKRKFNNINFRVHSGEILGIAGLMGAGRTELVEAIFGVDKADSGEIIIKGRKATINNPRDAITNGIALVSEDRKIYGLNLKSSVKDNITLANLDKYCLLKQIINMREERKIVDQQIKTLDIKTPSRNKIVNTLSGGNQQKVVIAKWLLCNPDILILDEPTRGIDIGAKAEIHKIMTLLAKKGKAIIMISSEMPEILGMSDRVIVLHEGEITGEFRRKELDQEKIMACATGHVNGKVAV